MKKSPPRQKETGIEDWRICGGRQLAQDFRPEGEEWIVRWRTEISNAPNVPIATKRTVSQLSDAELALYLAGKQQREKRSRDHAVGYGAVGWL